MDREFGASGGFSAPRGVCVSEGLLGALGAYWEVSLKASWAFSGVLLGLCWAGRGPSWAVLRPSWAVLGGVGRLEALLVRSWTG